MSTATLPSQRLLAFMLLSLTAAWVGAGRLANKPVPLTQPQPVIPIALNGWAGKALPVDKRVIEILETNAVSSVEYRRGQEPPVWLAQVAGFGNRAAFHPPEICYVGSHFEVVERGPIAVAVGGNAHRLMRLVIRQDNKLYEAWYWFTASGRVTPNYYQQQAWLLWDALRGRPSSGTLVRISTPMENAASAHSRLRDFLASWL